MVARVVPGSPGDRYTPSVDRLFESAAKHVGRDLLAVVLTGMGDDGRLGVRSVQDAGGSVLADTAAVHLAQSTPATHRRATWLCHDMITNDTAPGQGARNDGGTTRAPDLPGVGVTPNEGVLGEPVAVYG